jgi:membrane-bound metal-dependent hydrolase YbcI (DUF457 family)
VRGVHHLLLSSTTGGLIFASLVPALPSGWLPPLALGLVIGSLAPDADAADAAILHPGMPGRGPKPRGFSRWILPFFGYLIRYLVYYPAWAVLRILFGRRCGREHRGLLHSLLGVTLTTLLTSAYLALALMLAGGSGYGLLPPFAAAFLGGSLLHLVQDSCTLTGIRWEYPWSDRAVHGSIRTGSRDIRSPFFAVLLAAGGGMVLATTWVLPWLLPYRAGVMSLFLLLAWAGFLIAAGVRG